MVDWPTDLPGYLTGITDKRGKTRVRSTVDVGPAIVRKRYTAAVRNVNLPVRFSNAERIIFDTFYETDLDNGINPFNWTDPVSGDTVSFRFRTEDAPEFKGEEGGEFVAWTATLELEILP